MHDRRNHILCGPIEEASIFATSLATGCIYEFRLISVLSMSSKKTSQAMNLIKSTTFQHEWRREREREGFGSVMAKCFLMYCV